MGSTFLCCFLAEVHGDGSFVLHHLPLAGKCAVISSHVIKRQMFEVSSSVFNRNSVICSLLVNELSQEVTLAQIISGTAKLLEIQEF